MIKITYVFLFLTFLLSRHVNGQIQNSLFKNYMVQDGLVDEKIHCVFQDSKGWIWVGTDYGVSKFDGYEFIQLNLNDSISAILAKSLVRNIFEDSHGNIWIGSDIEGVFQYISSEYKLVQHLKGRSVWDFYESESNKLLVATTDGLFSLDTKNSATNLIVNKKINDLTSDFIRKIYVDNTKRIWLGTDNGITVLNSDYTLYKKYLVGDNYAVLENEVWDIFLDDENQIWVGTYLGGVKQYNESSDSFTNFTLNVNNDRSHTVRTIIQDKNGDIWFGTRGGLYSFDYATRKIRFYEEDIQDDNSLVHNSVLALLIDKKGDLWVGTRNGLSYLNFNNIAFGYISANSSQRMHLNNSEVYELWEDNQKQLWIGTESGGVNIYNPKTNSIKYLTETNGLSNNCIKAISPDGLGNVLIGTYLGGLNQYNPITGRNKIFKNDPNDSTTISDDAVWLIFTDSHGRIWVATSKGADVFDPISGTFQRKGKKFKLGWVDTIHEDNEGNFWIFSTDKNILTCVHPDESLDEYTIESRSLCNDNLGNVWIGSLGEGLIKFNLKLNTFDTFTVDSGLCSNVILGVVNVNNTHLWISTNNGLSRFNLATNQFKNFYGTNGLINSKFNYGAYDIISDNILVFGGNRGVDFVFLDKLKDNNYIPPIAITGFRIFNKMAIVNHNKKSVLNNFIDETEAIVLPYFQNMISFSFSSLDYSTPQKNKYKYMLQGFDKDWNDIGANRSANYTNLDHGDYVFKVVGSNSDGIFNTEGTELKITILPPFWKTIWFRLLMLLAILFLFYIVYLVIINRERLKNQLFLERQSARKFQELDRLKHQFFMNISHEIKTPLSLITGPLNQLLSNKIIDDKNQGLLAIINRNTTNLSKLVSQLLDYRKLETGNLKLNLKKGNLVVFVEEIVNSFSNIASEKMVTLNFQIFQKSLFLSFDEDKIEKILNNLISNAIKYTLDGGNITVSLSQVLSSEIEENNTYLPSFDPEKSQHDSYVKLTVADTGVGIPSEQITRVFDRFRRIDNKDTTSSSGVGIGLALTKELIKLHNGFIKVKSKMKKGSKFTVLIPNINIEEDVSDQEKRIIEKDQGEEINTVESDIKNSNQPYLLIVDDNPDIREFIKTYFEPEYKIFQARNGKEGWELALEQVPDIIIADVMMPIMNGNDLCRKLKGNECTSHIPILMLTALSSADHQIAGIDSGADDYLTKPFDVGLLKAKTDNILAIRKSLRDKYSKEILLKPRDIVLANPDEKFIKKLVQIVEKNIAKSEFDVDMMAKSLGVSRTQLFRKINALTNMTPKELVRDIRLKRAAQLLTQDVLNINEIAIEVGISDISYFRKLFKEKYGMNASKYQKQEKNNGSY
jgi:signal transduction histidine kinase/ligand-binding sensor domain-containing protein/DNA-binding response OmpR family regulator